MEDQNIIVLQRRLVDELIEKKFIKTREVEEAFLTVQRHLFLPGVDLEKVYSNTAIVTKWDGKIPLSSSSEPAVYAIMLEQLELKEGLKILEIGAGTGFNAALMAQITSEKGKVITVDIDKDITDSARVNLNGAGFSHVNAICKDGSSGYAPEAPYDRIIITAGVWDINPEWFNQLKPGCILLVPMVIHIQGQATFAFKRVNNHLESTSTSGCKFMELRGDFPRPVNWVEIGSGKVMMLCTGSISELSDEISNINVKNQWEDFSTNIELSLLEMHRQLLPWLEITESKFCFLVSKIETSEILNLPVLPKHKGKSLPALFGLAEKDDLCLIYFNEEKTETETQDMNMRSFKLHARNYGSDDTLAKHLVERIIEWDKTGRPGIQNANVKAYLNNSNVQPAEGEYLIAKKWVNLLFSWKSFRI